MRHWEFPHLLGTNLITINVALVAFQVCTLGFMQESEEVCQGTLTL